jgi:glycerol-3-phosphate dehydrogenase subunit B
VTRVVVIGGGIAGTGAALAARAAGAEVTLLDGGAGASSLAGGAMDVTSWEDTPREGDPSADDVLAEPAVAAALNELHELVRPAAAPATVATMAGIVRPARAVDRALLDLAGLTGGIVFVPRADHPGWDAGALARAWNDTRIARARGVEFVALDATLTRFVDERHLAHAELAARHDEPARLAWLAARVKDALGRRTEARVLAVVVPPWLGIEATREAALSSAVGVPCGEPLAGPGGPSGLRFERARDRAFARREIAVVAARAKEIAQDGHEWHVSLERGASLVADRVVLATGGLIGGGLAYAPSNAVLAGEVPARARASFASTVDAPVTIGAGGRALGIPGSLFGESPETLAWPFAVGAPLLETAGVLATSSGHVQNGLYAAGDVVADRPRTWLGALAQGARAGAAAAT